MSALVLSLFPGGGLLDYAFEREGFCVVRGPDVIWGGDVRRFHPPGWRFDGIIGGDPCQSHSSLANLVRAKGLEPSFPDLTGEYQRVVEEAQPRWFLRENVPRAPDIMPKGYNVRSFLLDNWASFGEEQSRRRRFWFGVRDDLGDCPELRAHMQFALEIPPDCEQAVVSSERPVPIARGGSGKRKVTAVGGHDGTADAINGYRRARQATVLGRNEGRIGPPGKDYSMPRRTLAEMCELQGLPPDWLEHQPWTMQAKRKIVGNGVAVPTGRQLARAIREVMG